MFPATAVRKVGAPSKSPARVFTVPPAAWLTRMAKLAATTGSPEPDIGTVDDAALSTGAVTSVTSTPIRLSLKLAWAVARSKFALLSSVLSTNAAVLISVVPRLRAATLLPVPVA